MALDPSIIMQAGRGVEKPRNMLQQYGNVLALRNAQEESEMRRAAMEQQAAQRRALSGAVGPDGAIDDAAVTRALAGAGDVRGLSSWQTSRSTMAKNKEQSRKAKLEAAAKELDLIGRHMNGVMDQNTWSAAKQSLGQANVDVSEMPDMFDPQLVQTMSKNAITAQKRLDMELAREKFEEDKRHNRTTEGLARGGAYATNVVMPPQYVEDEAAKRYGAHLVDKDYGRVDEDAVNAQNLLDRLYIAKGIDVQSGAFEPAKAWASAAAEGLGFDPEKVGLSSAANAQAYEGIVQQLVLAEMQAQKGPQTENDAKRITMTVASLKNTPEAKQFLTDAAIALNLRKIQKRDFYQQHEEDTRSFRGASKAWNEWQRENAMMGNNPNTGRPVFYHQFESAVAQANPGIRQEEIREMWRNKYGTTPSGAPR